MAICRLICEHELDQLLRLYAQLQPSDPVLEQNEQLFELWHSMLHNPMMHIIVVVEDGKIIASCVLIIIYNLTRNARPYSLIENVITDEAYRKRGFGHFMMQEAIRMAQDHNCYKIMLMTGTQNEETHHFYESVGFNRKLKTGYIYQF